MSDIDYAAENKHDKENTGRLLKQTKIVGMDFIKMHQDAIADGALSKKEKELMALSISIVIHCEGCINSHLSAAKDAGATIEEVVEAVDVAIMMNGGPAIVYGGKALEAAEQYYGVDLK
ncbi:carboxymuconolactone decarboxylase family protein [Companilactobacillus mishanensis]|nr:carboxymuconolactone decarboxylase family protein [Companilactobacillus mishanensis]